MINSKPDLNGKNNSSKVKTLGNFEPIFEDKGFDTYSQGSIKNKPISEDIIKCSQDQALAIMQLCPKWDHCNAPKCPLDPFIKLRYEEPGDPKCKLSRNKRHEIWENLPEDLKKCLPFQGYFEKEYNYRKRFFGMTEGQKQELISRLKKNKGGVENGKSKSE